MGLNSYVPVKDLKEKIEALEKTVKENAFKTFVSKEFVFKKEEVFVDSVVMCKGDKIDLTNQYIRGVVLSTREPEVYRDMTISNNLRMAKLRIVIHVDEVKYSLNVLQLPEKEYYFYAYEDYLRFFTQRYLEIKPTPEETVSVWSTVKEAEYLLPTILTNMVHHVPVPRDMIAEDFTMLPRYRELPGHLRNEVDRLVCPIIVRAEDVSVNTKMDRVNIRLDQKELLQSKLCTDMFKDELVTFLNQLSESWHLKYH